MVQAGLPKGRRQIKEVEEDVGLSLNTGSIWRRPVGAGPGWSVALTEAVVGLVSIEGVELMLNVDVE